MSPDGAEAPEQPITASAAEAREAVISETAPALPALAPKLCQGGQLLRKSPRAITLGTVHYEEGFMTYNLEALPYSTDLPTVGSRYVSN